MGEIDVPDLTTYFPYVIYAIVVGAVIVGFAQDHRILAIYCIVMSTLVLIAFIWEGGL